MRKLQRSFGMTALDRLILETIVDARQGVAGALSKKRLTKAIDEFVSLNGRRWQSYFHAGFRDAEFGMPLGEKLPARDEQRARWYWAGVVQGFARSNSWARIAEAYDSNGTVRALGDGSDRASRGAGVCIAEALWKLDRSAELPGFVHIALARRPNVYKLLLEAGTESLRSRSPVVAQEIFALLMKSAEASKVVSRHAPTVRRRMAHCHRLLGEHQRAEGLLRGILGDGGDPEIHAMVHADLGLLKGRFTLLDEVRIPADEMERPDLVERLGAGEQDFRNAIANPDAVYASHGHYCLGVLALTNDAWGDQRFEEAAMHLERAHAHIRSKQNYPPSLVAQIELYLGIAKTQLFEAGEIDHAAHLIAAGLKGATMPNYFVARVVENLALSETSIAAVAEPMLASGGDDVLDALAATGIAATHAPLAEKLRERAQRPNQPKALAAADLRAALRGFLGVGDIEMASQVLDELERLAVGGFGVTEFLELLDQPDSYDPAWGREDAAVASARCLETDGRYDEALAQLRRVFHTYMHRDDIQNAAGILDRIRSYGLEAEMFHNLEARYAAVTREDTPEQRDHETNDPVTVLFVGGDEVEAKRADRVRSKVASRDPNTTVEFLHTGWSSGWNRHVDEIKRRIEYCDAVVVTRFIRTMLGGHVRSLCGKHDVPWRFCWGRGQGTVTGSVVAAANAARAHKKR